MQNALALLPVVWAQSNAESSNIGILERFHLVTPSDGLADHLISAEPKWDSGASVAREAASPWGSKVDKVLNKFENESYD